LLVAIINKVKQISLLVTW